MKQKLHLFEAFGIELEYMVVDKTTLKAKPIVEKLIFNETGDYSSDVVHGSIAWSNELVAHVVELKTNGPAKDLQQLAALFHKEVVYINEQLAAENAMLLPTAMHPFFNPLEETVIWPHEYNEVYALYDRIFNCKGHGWSNLQSMHINLPFANDEEFEVLHAAIRTLLPIIPALSASSPFVEGKKHGFLDARLAFYQQNQKRIPIIAGMIVPEAVYSKEEYENRIFKPIAEAISPFDDEDVLDKHFLNSRGAIARFDRGAIEIRIIDLQEAPKADLAIAQWVVAAIKWLIKRHESELEILKDGCTTTQLWSIYQSVIENGKNALITDASFLETFGIQGDCSVAELLNSITEEISQELDHKSVEAIDLILKKGSLSERILREYYSGETIQDIYFRLAKCLEKNCLFKG